VQARRVFAWKERRKHKGHADGSISETFLENETERIPRNVQGGTEILRACVYIRKAAERERTEKNC